MVGGVFALVSDPLWGLLPGRVSGRTSGLVSGRDSTGFTGADDARMSWSDGF
jgi:hypothetical protein